jgi:hypothetical protein
MANSTINGLTETTTPAANDQFVVWSTSANGTRKIKGENLDKLVFRSRTTATATTGKSLPLLSYTGGVPVVETLSYAALMSEVATVSGIGPGTISYDKLAANIRFNPWVEKTSNYTSVTGDRIAADTSAGAFTVTLPATPVVFDWVLISDIGKTWKSKALTIARNNSLINGLAENLVCDLSSEVLLRYEGATQGWRVFSYGY